MPNRILKESICISEQVDNLTWFEEVMFYRLIVNCDDYGRFDGRIPVIRNRLFTLKENLTNKQVSAAINKLASVGLVVLYEYEDRPFLYLPTWNEHQTVRAQKSKYPDPLESNCKQMISDDFKCSRNRNRIRNTESNPIRNTVIEDARVHEGTSAAAELVNFYSENISRTVPGIVVDAIGEWLSKVEPSLIRYAIEQAATNDKRNWAYINKILESHFKEGRKTGEAARVVKKGDKGGKKSRYDFEELERKAFEEVHGRGHQNNG